MASKLLCARVALVILALSGCLEPQCVAQPVLSPPKGMSLITGTSTCPIYVEDATAAHGKSLAEYLKKMSGKDFNVETLRQDAAAPEGPAVLIRVADDEAPRLGGDSFTIKTEAGQLRITGETPLAAGFGVFAFLEQELGCTWWSYDEEEVPTNTALEVRALNLTVKAPFRQTILSNREATTPENDFRFKSRGISTENFTGGHTAYGLLKAHAATHPEIYPMNKNGERKGNDLHFCYLAPGIVEALCDGLEKEVAKRNGNIKDWIYFAGMGDWYGGMCECPACKKVYEEETWTDPDGKKYPGYSATLLRMMNAVGETLEKKYPGIRVGTFAYMSLDAPPALTKPRSNVVLWMPHLRYCNAHAVTACKENAPYLNKLKRWLEIAPPGNVYVWDYSGGFADCWLWPSAELRSMAANLKAYHDLGCAGFSIEGAYFTYGTDLVVLKNYVWRKAVWDPQADVGRLIDEFCAGYYGPAAAAMKRYIDLLEDAAAQSPPFHSFFEAPQLREVLFTPELVERLRDARAAALAAAGEKQPYQRRVKEGTNGLGAWELNGMTPLPYLLAPKDGYLAVNGVVTWPRAVEMLKHSRGCTFREWGPAQPYHEAFLRSQGGPLVSLKRDGVEVVVAPTQSGRIYQLAFHDRPLLRSQYDSTDHQLRARFLAVPTIFRGSFERLKGPPAPGKPERLWLFTEREAQGNAITMEGNLSVPSMGESLWSGEGPRPARKTVEIGEGGVLRITGKTNKLDWQRKPIDTPQQVTTVTDYLVPADASFTVETSSDGKTWTRIDPAAFVTAPDTNNPAAKIRPLTCTVNGPAKALRIGLPTSGAVVQDTYDVVPIETVALIWDKAAGVLTIEVTTSLNPAGDWPQREIKVMQAGK